MSLKGIYAITDDTLLPGATLDSAVEAALQAGVSVLQYRSKQADAATKLAQAQALQRLCERYGVPLLINDDMDLAHRAGAAGVHLGRGDGDVAAARALLGDEAIIGCTCHADLTLARRAEEAGADYVAFGRFFRSSTKPDASPATLDILGQAKATLGIPVVAIGGINAENGASVIQAGADMLAVIHAIFGAQDIATATRSLCELFDQPT